MNEATQPFHIRYRPKKWAEVVGNHVQVKALQEAIKQQEQHAYLLSGPSGVGKTTLARIAAKVLGSEQDGLNEIDGATYTGIDDMRQLTETAERRPFGAPTRSIIVDECHSLSGKAWESLLKSVEEPAPFCYWFFCTTQPGKVPETLKTRAMHITLRGLDEGGIHEVLERVLDGERIELPEGVQDLIAGKANGSPRMALQYLAKVEAAEDYKEAAQLIETVIETEPAIAFCRFLCGSGRRSWKDAVERLEKLNGESPEGIRILVCNYVAKALSNAKTDNAAMYFLAILEAFATPYNMSEGNAPLYLSTGRIIFGGYDDANTQQRK